MKYLNSSNLYMIGQKLSGVVTHIITPQTYHISLNFIWDNNKLNGKCMTVNVTVMPLAQYQQNYR